jgi:hypothetical protein
LLCLNNATEIIETIFLNISCFSGEDKTGCDSPPNVLLLLVVTGHCVRRFIVIKHNIIFILRAILEFVTSVMKSQQARSEIVGGRTSQIDVQRRNKNIGPIEMRMDPELTAPGVDFVTRWRND